jgi:hypothetical protein
VKGELYPISKEIFEETYEVIELQEEPIRIIDIADMPHFNPVVKNGIHSVSKRKIFWTSNNYVTCKEHGARLCVSKDRRIWRCPTCNEGAYVEW